VIASPITGLVRTLNALIAGLAIQLRQIADEGLVGGGAEEAAPTEAEAEPEPADEPAADEQTDAPSEGDEDKE
jgi:hypothetical protein